MRFARAADPRPVRFFLLAASLAAKSALQRSQASAPAPTAQWTQYPEAVAPSRWVSRGTDGHRWLCEPGFRENWVAETLQRPGYSSA